MNHCNTTHNGSMVSVQVHRPLSVGWRGKGGQGMLPQRVGGWSCGAFSQCWHFPGVLLFVHTWQGTAWTF